MRHCGPWLWLLMGGGIWGCSVPVGIPLRPIATSPDLLETLTYPSFLQDAAAANGYRQRGLQLRQQGDLPGAIAALKTSVALDPTHVPSYVILGWTQHLAGQGTDATATLTRALTRDVNSVEALNAVGIVHLVGGDLPAAIAALTQAKTLKPDNEIAYYNLSLAYQRLPDLPAAIAHAQRATELEGWNPHPWVALALAYGSDQAVEESRAAYRQALRLDGRYRDRGHLDHLIRAGFSPEQIQQVDAIRQQSVP